MPVFGSTPPGNPASTSKFFAFSTLNAYANGVVRRPSTPGGRGPSAGSTRSLRNFFHSGASNAQLSAWRSFLFFPSNGSSMFTPTYMTWSVGAARSRTPCAASDGTSFPSLPTTASQLLRSTPPRQSSSLPRNMSHCVERSPTTTYSILSYGAGFAISAHPRQPASRVKIMR